MPAARARRPPPDCPLDGALRLLNGVWTAQIVWYLGDGPRRFGDLKRAIGAVSAKVLAGRLRDLEAKGVVTRTVRPTAPPTVEYAITPLGRRLSPILAAIARVGRHLPPAPAARTR